MANAEDDLGSMPTNPAPVTIRPIAVGILPGRVLAGRYEILAKLGHGGMGAVYRAHDRELGEDVALKVILPELIRDASVLDRFRREVKLARKIAHPNVCRVFDMGEEGNVRFLTMEFIEGKSLRALMAKGPLEPSRALSILHQIIQGMAAVHAQGIVHRDLKPDNVMVRDGGQAVVADFGLARMPTGHAAESNFAGTPAYMSPEQLRGQPLDGRSDIFALGIVAYEMLVGKLPFIGETIAEVATATLRDAPAPFEIQGLSEATLRGLKTAILRALEKKPEDRFASMTEFGDALLEAGVEHSAPTLTSSASRQSIPTVRWRFPAVGILAGTLLALGIALGVWRANSSATSRLHYTPTMASAVSSSTPLPVTNNPQALQLYRQARVFLHDGDVEAALTTMKRAVEIEPTFAGAHLQLALWYGEFNPVEGNKHYQLASQYSAELDPHDRDLLQAAEPWLRVPWNLEEYEHRLEALSRQYANDWEIWALLASVRLHRLQIESALDAANRALDIDVKAIPAWSVKAHASVLSGDVKAQWQAFDGCLEAAPRALKCLDGRIDLAARFGECRRMKDDATRRLLLQPEAALTYRFLATALETTDASRKAVFEALDKSYAFESKEKRGPAEFSARGALAVRDGDFVAAVRHFEQWQRFTSERGTQRMQAEPVLLLVRAQHEMGLTKEAGRTAQSFVERAGTWIPAPYTDPTMELLCFMYRAQMLSKDELERRRAEWATSFRNRWTTMGRLPGLELDWWVWVLSEGLTVHTHEEAVAALEKMPKERLTNANTALHFLEETPPVEGKVYVLAGKFDKAVESLRHAAAKCTIFDDPFEALYARFYLGMALQGQGNEAGAREAFQYVVDRWGKAKPRSVTAEQAKKALEKLGQHDKPTTKPTAKPANPFGSAIDTRR